MLSSNCPICGNKKLTFIKNKEIHNSSNKILLDKFIKHLTKHLKRIKKFREYCNKKYLYRN